VAKPAVRAESRDIPPHLLERIEAIRAELRQLHYRRWTDEELTEQLSLDRQAKANNAIEGLYADAAQEAFVAMLDEERLPNELRGPYVAWFFLGRKSAPVE
jgi:hypothetical protein